MGYAKSQDGKKRGIQRKCESKLDKENICKESAVVAPVRRLEYWK